jgi:hypothetical protein
MPIDFVGTVSSINSILGTLVVDDVDIYYESASLDAVIGIGSVIYVSGTKLGSSELVLAEDISALSGEFDDLGPNNLFSITGSSVR